MQALSRLVYPRPGSKDPEKETLVFEEDESKAESRRNRVQARFDAKHDNRDLSDAYGEYNRAVVQWINSAAAVLASGYEGDEAGEKELEKIVPTSEREKYAKEFKAASSQTERAAVVGRFLKQYGQNLAPEDSSWRMLKGAQKNESAGDEFTASSLHLYREAARKWFKCPQDEIYFLDRLLADYNSKGTERIEPRGRPARDVSWLERLHQMQEYADEELPEDHEQRDVSLDTNNHRFPFQAQQRHAYWLYSQFNQCRRNLGEDHRECKQWEHAMNLTAPSFWVEHWEKATSAGIIADVPTEPAPRSRLGRDLNAAENDDN